MARINTFKMKKNASFVKKKGEVIVLLHNSLSLWHISKNPQ